MIADLPLKIRKNSKIGHITICRPEALNAITFNMCMAIADAVETWQSDECVKLVIIDAQGDKAFSAGGDVAEIYDAGCTGDIEFSRTLWENEYPFQERLSRYPKPYIAFMDGIVMGLGAGVSVHGSHRIVTERTRFAMPECSIGLVPDTGTSAHFARAPGKIGLFLGLTGARINAADMLYTGLADAYVHSRHLDDLRRTLIETGDPACLERFAEPPAEASRLKDLQGDIDHHFSKETVTEIITSLEASTSEWAQEHAKLMRRASPLSLACYHTILNEVAKHPTVANAVRWEYRFTHRALSEGDFLEGVRAQIIDKDRNPAWSIPRIEEVSPDRIASMLADLGARALRLT